MIISVTQLKTAIIQLEEVCYSLDSTISIEEHGGKEEVNFIYSIADLEKDIQDCKEIVSCKFLGIEYNSDVGYSLPTYEVKYYS